MLIRAKDAADTAFYGSPVLPPENTPKIDNGRDGTAKELAKNMITSVKKVTAGK